MLQPNLRLPVRGFRPTMRFCCPLHAWPAGMAAIRGFAADDGRPPVSFRDETPKVVSEHFHATYDAGAQFFERPGPGQRVVVRNGLVLTMDGRRRLPNHDVVIRDGLIEAVVPTGTSAPDALELDATGRFVMPGLSDVHAHPFVVNWAGVMAPRVREGLAPKDIVLPYGLLMLQYIAAGVTRLEVMAGDRDTLALRDAGEAGRAYAPLMRVGSPLVDGPTAYHASQLSWCVADPDGAREAVRRCQDEGYDFLKPYVLLPADAYETLLQTAKGEGVRVMGHVPAASGIERALALGQTGIAHSAEYFYWLTGPERSDERRLADLARRTAEAGAWVQATLTVVARMEAYADPDLDPTALPFSDWFHPLNATLYAPDGPMMNAMRDMEAVKIISANARDLSLLTTRLLREAGVPLLTGVDAPNPYTAEGFTLHEELERLVDGAGLSPMEALEATTVVAARYHGEAGRAGVVRAGARADLVILDEDPTHDIRASRAVHAVVLKGVLLRTEARQRALDAIRAAYAAMPL